MLPLCCVYIFNKLRKKGQIRKRSQVLLLYEINWIIFDQNKGSYLL